MKVTVRLMGGLGNQMFQYAAGAALAKKLNTTLYIDKSDNSLKTHFYSLENFNLDCVFIEKKSFIKKIIDYVIILIQKNKILFKFNFLLRKYYFESAPFFEDKFSQISDEKYLIGYFQSEKYFFEYQDFIRNQFKFPSNIDEINNYYLNKIISLNSVSVHIRRGDYIANSSAKLVHGNCCTIDYYKNAVKLISGIFNNIELFIFSDDIEWVKNNIRFNHKSNYIDHNKDDKNIEDLRLMSLCKHNIIANSTFSWWGAYLNSNTNKIVIAPKKWFNFDDLNLKVDIIPSSWIKI